MTWTRRTFCTCCRFQTVAFFRYYLHHRSGSKEVQYISTIPATPYFGFIISSENINCLYLFTYQQSTTCVVACELIQHKEQSLKFQIPELKQGRWKKPGWVSYPFADSSFLLCFSCGIALTCSDAIICFSGEAWFYLPFCIYHMWPLLTIKRIFICPCTNFLLFKRTYFVLG